MIGRANATSSWKKNFKEWKGREPNYEEGHIFGTGFGAGWSSHQKVSSENRFKELKEIKKMVDKKFEEAEHNYKLGSQKSNGGSE